MIKRDSVVKLEKAIRMLQESSVEVLNDLELLRNDLRQCDLEVTDLQHYLEFATIDDDEACKVAREMKGLLMRRREIKNQMQLIASLEQILKGKTSEISGMNDLGVKIKSKTKEMNNKTYKPRIRVDLFENMKVEHVSQVNI